MAKRKHKAKRSLASLPKGLPQRKRGFASAGIGENPFETSSRQKRPKQQVHNRNVGPSTNSNQQTALARSLKRRQVQLKSSLDRSKKSNTFVDRRIGEYTMTAEEQALARIVRERSRRSKKTSKYSLADEDDDSPSTMLTHRGKAINDLEARDHILLSSDDEADGGDLEAIDTELHFGGGSFRSSSNPYGGANQSEDMAQVYQHKKTELDDLIARRKMLKAERVKSKETQVEAFETMDESFSELAAMLNFRDKEKEHKERLEAKRAGKQSKDDLEMAEWDKEMKGYLFDRKVKATDRTKTPDEIAAEEAERLQELETRRLARMNGDFENDDLSDISDDDEEQKSRYKKKISRKTPKRSGARNPDELYDSDEERSDNELEARFTADGLVYLDKEGNIVKKAGDKDDDREDESDDDDDDDVDSEDSSADSESSDDSSDDEEDETETSHGAFGVVLAVGTRVQGNYRADEQYEGKENWYEGAISKVNKNQDGTVTYCVDYDDGDFEEDMKPINVRPIEKSKQAKQKNKEEQSKEIELKAKRQKAKKKARQEIPFVFEVPTTLEALHDMIGTYASTGADASLIIQRIHKANSVRLDKRNVAKMQNFYDVLLRRFIAVGDAIHESGDGGEELGRFSQLDALTQTLYAMSQDSPGCAGAVWSRRLGIFQNALSKRLRDSEFIKDDEAEEEVSAWPSTGTFLLLRALGHVFPVTDKRHHVVTPALLLLGQIVSQTPVRSLQDLSIGIMCCGLMVEYTKDAKRIAPEALSFLAGVLRLFAADSKFEVGSFPAPTVEAACRLPPFQSLRTSVSNHTTLGDCEIPKLPLNGGSMNDSSIPTAIICSVLNLVRITASELGGCLNDGDTEIFAEITESLLCLKPKSKRNPLPEAVVSLVVSAAKAVSDACKLEEPRLPLMRRTGPSVSERAIKTLAPRMEDPSRYSLSKDKGKTAKQAAIDRMRREYKREHKAVSRELRLDAAFIEHERRKDKERKDRIEREKRHKNFAWLEGEQAAMNQQVRQGGALLSGGGTGAAHAKAKNAQMGIKKGGKFRS